MAMLSLTMIVKNEEKHLRECLLSVMDLVDEIVLVDTGSIDNTKEIASEFGAKIYDFTWVNDFSAARNFALSKATGNWILYLDADERIHKNSLSLLKKLISTNEKKAYNCRIINIDEFTNRPSVMAYVRLFANSPEIQFEGKVHEQIETSLVANGYQIEPSAVEIIHVGYNLEKEKLKAKALRNLEILLEEYKSHKNGYVAFQIGQSLHILEREREAVEYFNFAIVDDSLRKEYKAVAYRSIAVFYADELDFPNAEKMINKSLKYDNQQPLTLMAAAKIYAKLSRFTESINCVKDALRYNKLYLSGKMNSAQNILVDSRIIIYLGLNLGLLTDDRHECDYFLKEWYEYSRDEEYKFFEYLIKKKGIPKGSHNVYDLFSIDNIELLLTVLGQIFDKKDVIDLLRLLKNKFDKNAFFLNKYGLFLVEQGFYEEAEKAINQALVINPNDYSCVFYLISIYIHQGKIDKIFSVINSYRDQLSSKPELLAQLTSLEQKLRALA